MTAIPMIWDLEWVIGYSIKNKTETYLASMTADGMNESDELLAFDTLRLRLAEALSILTMLDELMVLALVLIEESRTGLLGLVALMDIDLADGGIFNSVSKSYPSVDCKVSTGELNIAPKAIQNGNQSEIYSKF
ncbi:hypothetical protein BDEG_23771 [Batrachochytrium dendrobatidis JEL423]|uniref:Uncharacterized protein n=1 Tax=Batrachochytrium dendrobatidis (strain JEL423) TaxID=403673 RepID=A0A177WJY7_BATDL|nr:hypothetical protein BDEG_23771 [Batrachochytrium dendrobatidis JEL423]